MKGILMILRKLGEWLFPEAHKDAQKYKRLHRKLEESRWWIGLHHPEAASLVDFLLRQEDEHWSLPENKFNKMNPWTPPSHVKDIVSYREWLESNPFSKT